MKLRARSFALSALVCAAGIAPAQASPATDARCDALVHMQGLPGLIRNLVESPTSDSRRLAQAKVTSELNLSYDLVFSAAAARGKAEEDDMLLLSHLNEMSRISEFAAAGLAMSAETLEGLMRNDFADRMNGELCQGKMPTHAYLPPALAQFGEVLAHLLGVDHVHVNGTTGKHSQKSEPEPQSPGTGAGGAHPDLYSAKAVGILVAATTFLASLPIVATSLGVKKLLVSSLVFRLLTVTGLAGVMGHRAVGATRGAAASCDFTTRARIAGTDVSVHVLKISPRGCTIEAAAALSPGTRITLVLDGARYSGTIAWCGRHTAGLQFESNLPNRVFDRMASA